MADGFTATEDFSARVLEGRALADGGDYPGAERHFRALLAEARAGHPGNHARAMSSLVTLYGRGGRYLEAHLLARRLADVARAAGPEGDALLAFALGAICGALSQLRLTEPLGSALADFRAVLDRLPEPAPGLEAEYRSAAGAFAVSHGDFAGARRHLVRYRAVVDATEGMEPVFRWALTMGEAQLAYHEGRPADALQLVAQLGSEVVSPPFHDLKELALGVAVQTALGNRAEARRLGAEAIRALEAVPEEAYLASGRIHQGAEVARELEALGELDLAHRVYDLVAAAVIIRFRQVDECLGDLPELGLGDAETTAVLARFRKQFLREQRALLERVAGIFESRGAEYIRSLLASSAPEGFVAICAWCESVRPSADRWLPIGHFIPREGPLKVTHGICPTCAQGLHAESA